MDNTKTAEISGNPSDASDALSVHYNGACPICRPEVEHYKRTAEGSGISGLTFVDITTSNDRLETLGISLDDAARSFTVVDAAGKVHQGVDAFILLWRRLPRFRILAAIIAVQPIKWLADVVYDRLLAPILYWSNKRAGRI
jgi:predicted DCC family thiol-disulfide oxidoreductase YuxK